MPRKKSEIKKTKLETKIEEMTLENLLTHYVQLRFYLWDGTGKVEHGPEFYVFECLPDIGKKEGNRRTSSRFHTMEEAKAFMEEARDRVKEQLLTTIMDAFGDKDGDAGEAGESPSTVRLGSEDPPISGSVVPPF